MQAFDRNVESAHGEYESQSVSVSMCVKCERRQVADVNIKKYKSIKDNALWSVSV